MQCWNSYCSPGYPDVSNGLLAILLDPPGCLDDGGMIGSSWRDDGMVGKIDRDDWVMEEHWLLSLLSSNVGLCFWSTAVYSH